jgi:hypothetical protein
MALSIRTKKLRISSKKINTLEFQNIFPKWVIFVVSYILVSLSDNLLIFDFCS